MFPADSSVAALGLAVGVPPYVLAALLAAAGCAFAVVAWMRARRGR